MINHFDLFGLRQAYLAWRGLVAALGDQYREYRRQVPMLLPWPRRRRAMAGVITTARHVEATR
jgi:protein-S-isoprenylcysteine O-methyltransferase Ste14